MLQLRSILESRYFLWLLLSAPLVILINGYAADRIFYGEIVHASGEWSARLLLVALAASPMRLLFPYAGWTRWLMRNRRYFGVATFFYALLHTIVYVGRQATVSKVVEDSLSFEMWTGWLALLLFFLLALTSNDYSVRRLRSAWKKLHRWVYAAAILSFLHWIFIAFNFIPGVVHLSVLIALQSIRVVKSRSISA
jgi:sulfoxide reductase heme-binding subunit YedZ